MGTFGPSSGHGTRRDFLLSACSVCTAGAGGDGVDYCTERLYQHFTHVCTARPDVVPSYRACCCRLPSDALLCCRHLYDPLTYFCVDSVDIVGDMSVTA